jgi:hypothetical protein
MDNNYLVIYFKLVAIFFVKEPWAFIESLLREWEKQFAHSANSDWDGR